MADLTILRDAAYAYAASMSDAEWEAFAASVREPSDTEEAPPTSSEAKKARATAAFRRAGGGTAA
ncbi:hypothetical protein [Nocardia fusca]|uniref:hypothetical protein n=1 Tax=Nocardia fusca TaxID=941183 RepID=UPI0007A76154|nr:hypothetical protein [Nocardia fusca]